MSTDVRKPLLKIIILGDSGVGKTSLINQYVNRKFTLSYRRTVGADFATKDVFVDDKVVTLQIWDTVGQERFQSIGVPFYRGADCVILVYDVTSLESLESLKLWKDEFVIQGAPSDLENFPFIVLGNKIDLEKKCSCEGKLEDIFTCNYIVPHYETSAKDNINVDETFSIAAKMALERERQEFSSSSFPGGATRLDSNIKRPNNCYC